MSKRRDTAKDKLASGLLRGAVVSGLVSGLAAASLGGVPTANATCLGIFGISINLGGGGHCSSSLFGFALGLGPGTTATADGLFTAAIATGTDTEASSAGLATLAYAGGTDTLAATQGILNLAAAGLGFAGPLGVGTNVAAFAGARPLDFVNIAVNIGSADENGTSAVEASDGAFNLAGNLFGNANSAVAGTPTSLTVLAGGDDENLGFGTVAANVFGNRNHVEAIGTLVNATNWGNVFTTPNGSDSTVTAGTVGSPTSLSWAFNYQGIFTEACPTGLCGNTVNATGPLSIAGAIGVVRRDVSQDGPGISLATQFNDTGIPPTNVLAAGGTQGNRVRPGLNAAVNRPKATSPGASVLKSISDRLTTSANKFRPQGSLVRPSPNAALTGPKATSPRGSLLKSITDRTTTSVKNFNDTVSRAAGGPTGTAPKPGAASTNNNK